MFTLSIALGIFLIVLFRQGLAVYENIHLLRRLASNETELHHRAERDPLTDLHNRASFIRFVDDQLARRPADRLCAVMFVDLDDFKHINDSLGHSFGDQAIVVVGERLKACMRDGDLVARLGGDEFAIFLRDLPNVDQMVSIAERLIEALNEPFESSDMRASVCGTIGMAIAESGGRRGRAAASCRHRHVRRQGEGQGAVRDLRAEHARGHVRAAGTTGGPRARRRGEELTLHFQPVVDVPTREMVGVEALLRWDHPHLGLLGPRTSSTTSRRAA